MTKIVDVSEVLLELGLQDSPTEHERAICVQAITRAQGAVERYLGYDPASFSRTEFYPVMARSVYSRPSAWEIEGNQAVLRYRVGGPATDELQIRHIPIRGSTAIDLRIDYGAKAGTATDSFAAATQKTEGTDYWPNYDRLDSASSSVCTDGIIRSIGRWPVSPGTVKITYTGGYSEAELRGEDTVINASPIWETVLREAARRAKKVFVDTKHTGAGFVPGLITSERLGDYSYTIGGSSKTSDRLFGGANDLLPESRESLAPFVNYGWMLAA